MQHPALAAGCPSCCHPTYSVRAPNERIVMLFISTILVGQRGVLVNSLQDCRLIKQPKSTPAPRAKLIKCLNCVIRDVKRSCAQSECMVNLRYYFIACTVGPKDRADNYGGNTCKIATRVAVRKASMLGANSVFHCAGVCTAVHLRLTSPC